MSETLLTPSGIKLYGRLVIGLAVAPIAGAGLGDNNFLRRQLAGGAGGAPNLARIYGFSYEGSYHELPRPAIFVVHGPGVAVALTPHHSTTTDHSGVVARNWEFSDQPHDGAGAADLFMWEYDKGDFSIRLDVEAGTFEHILLEMALHGTSVMSGADARISGADARISGADARISGADARIRR